MAFSHPAAQRHRLLHLKLYLNQLLRHRRPDMLPHHRHHLRHNRRHHLRFPGTRTHPVKINSTTLQCKHCNNKYFEVSLQSIRIQICAFIYYFIIWMTIFKIMGWLQLNIFQKFINKLIIEYNVTEIKGLVIL